MRNLLIAALVLAIAAPAFAEGANPNIAAYVTFDQGAEVHRVDPAAYTAGQFFICLKYIQGGFTTVSLAVAIDPGVSAPVSYTSLLPGGLAIGTWADGITLSSTECMTDSYVCIGSGDAFYLGTPGMISIIDHPDYPRWVVDCNSEVDFYCYITGGGVLMDPTPTGEECPPPSPVEESTWGGIKALYR